MSLHRMKCRSQQCAFEGQMEATAEQSFVKKAFLEKQKADNKSKGVTPAPQLMRVRCPKCGMRWRIRSDQLR